MGTKRRLLISIGGLLIFLTSIHAQGQQKVSEEDWDSVDQKYGSMDVENFDSEETQQTVGEDDEDIQQQSDGSPSRVNIISSLAPVYQSLNPSHNQKICSTFGNHHYKTFDGDIFHFPGHCSYQFVRHCKSNYEEFFVGITRQVRKDVPVISGINMKVDGVEISLAEKIVIVNNEDVDELPFSIGGTQISKTGTYIRISSKIGFELFWNEEDSITVELSQKYANHTCGICGDYNGIPIYNEFIMNNAHLTNRQYGNLQKYQNPEEEKCEDTMEEEDAECPLNKHLCTSVLTGAAFQECNKIVEVQKYIELCEQDICRCTGNSTGFCLCNIFTEYSRQCTHAGGKPKNWRTSKICPLKCAYNLQFKECGTACPDTCTNPERSLVCDDHCTDGCFCPAGLMFDDIRKTGCIPKEQCACTHNGDVYPSGTGYSEKCQDCTCQGGKWSCAKKACFGVCALEGGSHITTFDLTRYNFHGDCIYTLAKTCDSSLFSILAELHKCGHTDTETCLRGISVSLNGGNEFIFVKKCGSVYINSVYTQLPVSTATATIFMPTSFYVIIQTKDGIQVKIQLVPTMQVYVAVDPKYMAKMCGLCGNFNDIQADDFKSPAGVIEGTGSSFGNLWKTQLDCPNVKNNFEDPCALIGQNEQYASHHCDVLLASDGPFASCHKTVDPEAYHKNCMFDACNCEKKEDCMCSALSSYVSACSRQGVDFRGWRTNTCHSYTTTCLPGHVYSYTVSTCLPSCRSLSEPDLTCQYDIGTIDGCICEDGTYRDDSGNCVLPALCSCYYKGTAMSPGEVMHENGAMCTCTNGKLECIGVNPVVPKECEHPKTYFDCDNATAGAKGSECQKSCSTFDTECYSTGCVSGCVCPEGLVLDDERNICIPEDECPCRLNDDYYAAGETVQVKCNTCTCKHKKWECTTNTCLGTCTVYGDGHYLTFDNKRYRFNGNCWYTLAQDHCSNDPSNSTFRLFTENVPCGSQGTTCSKSIRLLLGNYELKLGDQKFDVVKRNSGQYVAFKVRQMGIYLVMEAVNGLVLVWDKKTTVFVKLDPKFEGKVCGLCGNYDGNAANDYITRSQSVVGDVVEFANSWKVSQRCPNAVEIKDTCASNPYRKAWSQKQCSIITSGVFASCHGLVDPVNYYEACVNDACACDSGGDCDCFCNAVAAYSQACSEAGQCIRWRTPNICPVFCDFYNQQGHCEWHYQACGAPCLKTCMNPTGVCFTKLLGLEGCYPTCPEDRPFFDEESMRCVASCHCYDEYGTEYKPGEKMPSLSRCSVCTCTKNGRQCTKAPACCEYEGKEFLPGDIVYYTADGIGGCLNAICSENSTIERTVGFCPTTTAPTTTFDFSSSSSTEEKTETPSTAHEGSPTSSTPTESSPGTPSGGKSTERPITSTSSSAAPTSKTSTEAPTVSPTACVEAHDCTWSEWYDVSKPENSLGDLERFEDIEKQGHKVCKNPRNVECRAKEYPNTALKDLKQDVTCSRRYGLICLNSENQPLCHNYEIRIECCKYRECTSKEQTSTPTGSVSFETPPPTSKEHPTSLPVHVTSETPQKPETSKHPPTTSTGTTETTSSATEKTTTSSEKTPQTPAPTPTTTCVYKMECRWTEWYDKNEPNGRSDGGDIESVDDIESKGHSVCTNQEVENKIECEGVDDKGLPIADNNQKFSCDLNNGLVCQNRDQNKKEKCYNYKIRIECCQKVCETIPTPKVTTTETTEPKTTSSEKITQGTTGPEPQPSQVSTKPPSSTPSTPFSTGKPSPTTFCVKKMECRWTEWFDKNEPGVKSDEGDTESIADIQSSGTEVCKSREVEDKIECEALDKNGVPVVDNSQKFSCSLKDGVNCYNRNQINKEKCYNYRIRVLCCAEVCEPVPTPAISTAETSEPTTHGTSTTTLPKPGSTTISSTEKPSPSESTSPSLTSSEITTSATSTAACINKMDCRWTHWYDFHSPTDQSDGGDSESIEDIKSNGIEICKEREVENKIECEAIDHEGETIANNQQSLTCIMGIGLTCKNRDQKKEKCHNYRMRVQCCESYCEPVVTATTSSPVATQTSSPTTSSITKPTLSSPKDCENDRALECRWTQWFNENEPTTEFNGEERENLDKLRSLGLDVCKQGEVENQIECKDEQYSETAYKQNLAQKTTCNTKEGLICKNQDQSGENCHDYSIRVECCSEKFVKSCGESTTPSSSEVTSMPTTISVTSPPSTSVTGTKQPGTSSETTPESSTEVPSSTSSSSTEVTSTPTGCVKKMECRWTLWYDNNAPNPKGDGGDAENSQDIKAKGLQICNQDEVEHDIECEAINKDGGTVSDNQQRMTCDLENGLSCLNRNQKTKEKCHNYKIRFECCKEYCEKIETSTTTLAATTSITVTDFSSEESTPPGSPESSTPSGTRSPTSSTSVTTAPKTTSSTTKTESTSHPPATTTSCEKFRQSECHWTGWLNTDKPSPETSGEDIENSEKLRSEGIEVCQNEEIENEIECKAAQNSQLKYEDVRQNTKCNLKDGFICKNNEQSGEIKQCLDYEIRYECCSKNFIKFCGKTTPSPTSPSSSEVTGTTSITEKTSQPPGTPPEGTTPGQTSPSESPTSGQPSSEGPRGTSQPPGTQPEGTTPGQTSPSERPTSGQPPSEGPRGTSQPPSTPPEGTTPGQTSPSERPTSGQPPSEGPRGTSQPPGTLPEGTTPGQTSPSERPTSGQPPSEGPRGTSQPPGTPPEGTTPGQTSPSEGPRGTSQPPGTPPEGTTPGQTSPSERPTSGQPSSEGPRGTSQPPGTQPEGTTPGQTSPSERPTSGQPPSEGPRGTSQPPSTPPEGTTPGQTSPSERPTSGQPPSEGPRGTSQPPGTLPEGTTPGQTSPSERPTSGQPPSEGPRGTSQPPGTPPEGTTPGQTSPSEGPRGTSQPPGTPPEGTTPGQTSPSERPTSGQPSSEGPRGTSQPPGTLPEGTTPGQTSPSERPTSGQPPSERPRGTSQPPGTQPEGTTPGQTSPSERPTSGQPPSEGPRGTSQPSGSPPEGTTPGQTSSSERPTSGQPPSEGPRGTSQSPGTPPEGTIPGQTSSSERPSSGQPPSEGPKGTSQSPGTPPEGTTPGQTSPSERPTSGQSPSEGPRGTSQSPGTPPEGTMPGQTSPSEGPTSGQPPSEGPRGTSQSPGTPPEGTTPGQTSPSERPTSGQPPSEGPRGTSQPPGTPPEGTTPGQTSPSEGPRGTSQPPGTPPEGTTPGQTSPSEKPTSVQPSSEGPRGTSQPPGTPPEGTTPGQTSPSERPTSGQPPSEGPRETSQPPGTLPEGTTPGQTSPSEGPRGTSHPPGTPPEGTTPGQTSPSERPTSGQPPSEGPRGTSQPPGTQPEGTTHSQTSPSEGPRGTSQPPGTQPEGTTPGQTSPSEGPKGTSHPPGTPPEGTTPGQTSPSERPTSGQPPSEGPRGTSQPPGTPPEGTTPSQTSPSEGPRGTSQPAGTSPEGTTPDQTSPSERPTSGQPPSEGPRGTSQSPGTSPEGTTPGQTSPSEGPRGTSQQPGSPPEGTTSGQTSPSERPTSGQPPSEGPRGTSQPPGTPPEGTTAGQTSPSEGPRGTSQPPGTQPEGTTPGQTSPSEGPKGTSHTPGTPPEGTTPGQTSPSERPTSGQPPSEGPRGTSQPPGTPPEGTTPGQTSPSERPTSGQSPSEGPRGTSQPPGTPPEGTTPGQTSPSERPSSGQPPSEGPRATSHPPGTQPEGTTAGQTSPSEGPRGTSQPPGTSPEGTTPGQTSPSEGPKGTSHPPGTPPEGTTPGQTSPSERPTSGQPPSEGPRGTSQPPGSPPEGTTPSQTSPSEGPKGTSHPPGTPPEGTTPGQTSPSERPTSGQPPSEGPRGTSQPPGTTPEGTTPGQTSPSEGPKGTSHPPGTLPEGTTSGQTSPSERPTSGQPPSEGPRGTSQPPGTPPEGTTPGQTSPSEGPRGTSQPPGTPPEGTTPGQTSSSERPTSGQPPSEGPRGTSQPPGTPPEGTTPGQTSPSEGPRGTSQPPGTQPEGTTPGQTSPSEGPKGTSLPPGTPPEGTTPGQTSPSERPTSGQPPSEEPKGTSQPPGTQPEGTTPGQTSPSEGPKGTSHPPGTPPEGTTPGQTSPSEGPKGTSHPPGTSPEGTTPGQTSPSERPTSGQPPSEGPRGTSQPPGTPPEGTTPSQTSPSEGPKGTSHPPGTPVEGTTPGQTSPSERPTSGQPPSEGPKGTSQPPGTPPEGTTSSQTSPSERPTSGQPPSEGPRGTSQPPGTPPEGTTTGQTSPSEKPTSGQPPSEGPRGTSQPPGTLPEGTTPGQTPLSERTTSTPISSTSAETTPSGSPQYPTSPSSCKVLRDKECRWTEWLNKNEPSSEISGGEKENSENLRSLGLEVCKKEEVENDIECRAEKYPASYQNIEQVMTCNVKDGLICENKEQADEAKQCFDYAVRIECCSKKFVEECGKPTTAPASSRSPGISHETSSRETTSTPGTSTSISSTTSGPVTVTSTSGTTAHPTGSSPITTSSATPSGSTEVLTTTNSPEQTTLPTSPEASTSHPGTTTNCFCKVNDELFSPGETIYTRRDHQGCAFHSICSSSCTIEWSVGACSTTEPTPTSSEQTSIKDVGSSKPTLTRPSRRPGTGTEPSTSHETGTSTESYSAHHYSGYIDIMPHDNQPKQDVLRSYSLEGLGGTNETEVCGPCECLMPNCSTGYRVVSHRPPGACCAAITCVPDSVCVADNTVYKPGSTIPQAKNVCQKCECSKDEQDESGFYAVKCQELLCDKTCEKGFQYTEKEGECCGKCVPKQCTMKKQKVESGENAESGQKGVSGENKESGQKGESGENAESGQKGVTGENKGSGQKGVSGENAEGGQKGESGENSESGQKGESGENAESGEKGESGQKTESGQKGESGQKTESGQKGESGESEDEDSQIVIQIGDTYRPEGSTCIYYECDEEDGKPVLTKVKKVCQVLDISKCEEGSVKYDEDGCCQTCTPKTEVKVVEKPVLEDCSSRKNLTVLKEDDCEVEVELTHCGGPCMGTSMYSMESQGMDHKCSCCTELEVAERQVEMLCANGQRRTHFYKDVVRCGCSVATCEPLTSAEIQESQQQQQQQRYQTASKRRRRR